MTDLPGIGALMSIDLGAAAAMAPIRGERSEWQKRPPITQIGGIGVRGFSGIVSKDAYWGDAGLRDLDEELMTLPDSMETLILHIDSPGGYITGLAETVRLMRSVPQTIVAYTDGHMCSAAYHIALGADLIVGSESARIGSVGARMAILDMGEAFKEAGLELRVFDTGALKSMGAPGKPVTAAEAAYAQNMVDGVAASFRAEIERARGDVPAEVFEAGSFDGPEALALNLVDANVDRIEELVLAIQEEN